jgi:hypothetical protein
VVVADDQAHAAEAALDEAAHEAGPGAALVVAGSQLEAQDTALAGRRHAHRHQRGHRHDAARLAHLQVRRVEPQVGIALVGERSAAEALDLGVQRRAHAADLALAERRDPERLDEVLHPACRDTVDVRL